MLKFFMFILLFMVFCVIYVGVNAYNLDICLANKQGWQQCHDKHVIFKTAGG